MGVRRENDVDVDDVCRGCSTRQNANVTSLVRGEGHDIAATQEPPQLSLSTGTADLRHDRAGGERRNTQFQTSTMVCPDVPV
jgi:hypothetical protein